MKHLLLMSGLVWGAMVLEYGRPDLLPHGAILLPVVLAGMFWTASAGAILVGGLLLLLDWVVTPSAWPLLPVLLPLLTLLLVGHRVRRESRGRLTLPEWLQLVLLVLVGVSWGAGAGILAAGMTLESTLFGEWGRCLLVAVPLVLGLSVILKLADEFGLRRGTAGQSRYRAV